MRIFSKAIPVILLAIISLTACKKSILDDDPGNIENKNVKLQIIPYFRNYFYNPDSLYSASGSFFKIDEITILHSNYFFNNNGDSSQPADAALWSLTGSHDIYIGHLDLGSYSGKYYYKVGLDSLSNAMPPSTFPEGNPLRSDKNLYRGSGNGYNFVTIIGRILDPAKPNDEPSIPLKWVIATDALDIDYTRNQSLVVAAGKDVTIPIKFQIEKLFEGIFPLMTPIIESDPKNTNDWNQAQTLYANFKNKAYLIQI